MSYIKFDHRHLGDEKWLDTTPAAFVVHAWALNYCNEQATDGLISIKVAHRLNCPVEPVDLPAAWDNLVELGWWERGDGRYHCPGYERHCLRADEQNRTREKWAEDKRRRRLHGIGNHDLCTSHSKCSVARDRESTGPDSTSPQVESGNVHGWTSGRLDQTRPDQTPKGSGKGRGEPADNAEASPGCPDCGLAKGRHAIDCELIGEVAS